MGNGLSRGVPHGFFPLSPLVATPLSSDYISWFSKINLDRQCALFMMLGGQGVFYRSVE